MTPEILRWLKDVVAPMADAQNVVYEVGSYDVNGSARNVFDVYKWVGFDQRKGPGVDVVVIRESGEALIDYADKNGKADIVISCETLEHDYDPAATVRGMRASLKDGGLLVLTTPYQYFPYHPCPNDYFRVGMDWIRDYAFKDYALLNSDTVGNAPIVSIVAVARKNNGE